MELNLKFNFEIMYNLKNFLSNFEKSATNLENVIGGRETISKVGFNCLLYFLL